jgi:hypothetical protein
MRPSLHRLEAMQRRMDTTLRCMVRTRRFSGRDYARTKRCGAYPAQCGVRVKRCDILTGGREALWSVTGLIGQSLGLGYGDFILDPQSQPQRFGDLAQLPVLVVAEDKTGAGL